MAPRRSLYQISEIANGLIDPILARRAGINTMLIGAWEDIAGPDFADCTRPERIAWPRRVSEMGDGFEPGALTVACESARALFLSHAQDQLIQRVNAFFGFPAIDRIRIVQKPVAAAGSARKPLPKLAANQQNRLSTMLGGVEDPKLKAALERLGTGVIASAARR